MRRLCGPRWQVLWLGALFTASFCIFALTYGHEPQLFTSTLAHEVTSSQAHDRSYFPPSSESCSAATVKDENPASTEHRNLCATFPDDLLNDVQIVVKTGIGERRKLQTLLTTFGACISNALIFSDAEDVVEGHAVHDVLADLPASYATGNEDWQAYETQLEKLRKGLAVDKSAEGWKLDRFKFLPMIEKAHLKRPNARWYVFIETDTYFFWDVLFRVLESLDPDERYYLGSAAVGAHDVWFAYGGSGFILSARTLKDLLPASGQLSLSAKYEKMARDDCCGDALLAYVLKKELGLRVKTLYPTISGEQPQWLPIHTDQWCAPLIGLHHVSVEQIAALWAWERCRGDASPITLSAFLDFALSPALSDTETLQNWDNGADQQQPVNSPSHASASACLGACVNDILCLQCSYAEGQCRFANFTRLGQRTEDRQIISSWDVKKLGQLGWKKDMNSTTTCSETLWPVPKTAPPWRAHWWSGLYKDIVGWEFMKMNPFTSSAFEPAVALQS